MFRVIMQWAWWGLGLFARAVAFVVFMLIVFTIITGSV